MSFIVYEEDPFVRADICETLVDAFQGTSIVVAETVDGLRDLAITLTEPFVGVVSLPAGQAIEPYIDALSKGIAGQMVVIGDIPQQVAERMAYVPRPFSSDALVAAVRSALGDLPGSRT